MSSKRFSVINTLMIIVLVALTIVVAGMFGYRKYNQIQVNYNRLSGKILSEKPGYEDLLRFEKYILDAQDKLESKKAFKEDDLNELNCESFDEIHISMWNMSAFNNEWYYKYFAKNIYYSTYEVENPQDLKDYFDVVGISENRPQTIYINIDPYYFAESYYENEYYNMESTSYEEYVSLNILDFVEDNQDIQFRVFLPTNSLAFWSSMDEEKYDMYWDCWYNFVMNLRWWSNVHVSFIGDAEWLICNDESFVSECVLKDDVFLQEYLYLYGFDEYQTTPPELMLSKEKIGVLRDKRLSGDYYFGGLEGKDIVFYGDSVIAYTAQDTVSIPGHVQGMTGSKCYDMSKGGTTASQYKDNSFPEVTSQLSNKDYVDPIFVIMYGFNDYFNGLSLEDFEAGFLKGIENIKSAYPDAELLLMTPYTPVVGGGGIDCFGESGGTLSDYVLAIERFSDMYGFKCLNLYDTFDITVDNEIDYLADGVHPQYWLNLEISKLIARTLAEE